MKCVSVIIPVYNVEKYLCQCLDSVIGQTYTNLQIILVDDGSQDKSGSICNDFGEKDKRILVIHQENAGAACAKNTALESVRGDYFIFVDSDDYLEKSMVACMVEELEKSQADIVEAGFYYEYRTRTEEVRKCSEACELSQLEYLKRYIKDWTSSLLWNKIYKTSLLKDIRFRKERRCIDDEFFTYRIIMNAVKIRMIPCEFYHYRKRTSSAVMSKKNQLQITRDVLELLSSRYREITKEYPKLRKIYWLHLNETLIYTANRQEIDEESAARIKKMIWKHLPGFILNWGSALLFYQALSIGLCPFSKIKEKNTANISGKTENSDNCFD